MSRMARRVHVSGRLVNTLHEVLARVGCNVRTQNASGK
jgi:hypothetical protein